MCLGLQGRGKKPPSFWAHKEGQNGSRWPTAATQAAAPAVPQLWPLAPLLPVLGPSPPSTVQRLIAGHTCGRSCGDLSTPCLAVGLMASLRCQQPKKATVAGCISMKQPVLTSPSPVQPALGPSGRWGCLGGWCQGQISQVPGWPWSQAQDIRDTLCLWSLSQRGYGFT